MANPQTVFSVWWTGVSHSVGDEDEWIIDGSKGQHVLVEVLEESQRVTGGKEKKL